MSGSVNITIPKGTNSGRILRLKGKGMPYPDKAGQFGDLLVKVSVAIPQNLSMEEEELFKKLKELARAGKQRSNGATA